MLEQRVIGAAAGWLAPGGLGRTGLVALAGCIVLLATLPRGQRRWALWPVGFLLVAGLPVALALPIDHPDATATARGITRFLLLGSLLQSTLLVVLVGCWERVGRPLPRIFLDVLLLLAVGAALVGVLYESGVRAESLFTGSAVLTAVLGFALRDTLGNVFAGLAIHAEHPFEVGDWIQYDTNPAHIGKVVEINWRATKVITLDEAYVIIPNGQLAIASIRNFTKPDPWSRRSLFVVTPYDVPPQRVQAIVLEAIRGSFGVLEHPAPSVVTNAFTDRGVEHWVRLFTTAFDRRDRVDGMARDRIWYALARHGIDLPVATHAIRLTPLPPPEPVRTEAVVARRVAALRRVGLLDPLDEGLLERIAAASQERVFAAGEPIIRQDDPGTSLFVILSGRVEVTACEGAGPPARLAELAAGDYVGEMSLMTGACRVATVTALEETRVVEVDKEVFRHVLERHPELVEVLGRALHERMAERERAVAGVAVAPPEEQDLFRRVRDFFSL
jgi:small-conductance mechanosensitive channel/CRP-like cAMP-binding protein